MPRSPQPSRTPPAARPVLGRRAVLLGGAAAAVGSLIGCAGSTSSPDPSPTPSPSPSPTPDPTPSTTPSARPLPPLPDVPRYLVLPGEVEPACKQTAVDFATTALTAGTVATTGAPLEVRLAALGQPVAPAAPLLGLLPQGGASALEVVYPQYGGLSANRAEASVMLVAAHLVRPAQSVRDVVERRSITVDIRMSRPNGVWTVTEVLPTVTPPAAVALSPTALALLANDRVVLPAAARADVMSGAVNDAVLAALNTFAQRWRVHVQVFTSGHPVNVWATNRTSYHTLGKAVDIWALDDIPVIDQARCPWKDLMLLALDIGATEVGGPGYVPRGFANATHQDHVHVGFPSAV